MKRLSEINIGMITAIQVLIATIVSLLFQFVFPLTWQPLDRFMYGDDIQHGGPGLHLLIFSVSQWYFSVSIAWFFYRKNPWINNFLIYSIIPMTIIVYIEFTNGLYHDYIHLTPFIIDIYMLSKREIRDTLEQKYVRIFMPLMAIWLFTVYTLGLAYFGEGVVSYTVRMTLIILLSLLLSFAFRKKKNDG